MDPSSPPPDTDLVARARDGDRDAFARLVDRTEGLVRSTVAGIVDDRDLAQDVVQDTYLRAFRSLGSLRDSVAFVAWLRRVAVSTALSAVRRRQGTFVDPRTLDARPAAVADEGDGSLVAALHRAIASLSPAERRLCDRRYRGGWPTARLAREEGISEPAVRKRLERLRTRLGKEIGMTLDESRGPAGSLGDRIAELLARPRLVDLPDNPVGEVWDRLVALRPHDARVELPERLPLREVESVVSREADLPARIHRLDDAAVLRWDLSIPLLLAARGQPAGARLLAGGKVYRDEEEDRSHLQAFHQAELLWTGENLGSWAMMEAVEALLDDLLPGHPVRVEECAFPHVTDRGHEVLVGTADGFVAVAGWARYADRVVAALGLDPSRHVALGAGLGLERIACLRHGIEDLRTVESSRVR